MNSKQADMVQVQGGEMVLRSRVAYMLKEIDEVDDGSKVLQSFSGTLYGRDAKTGSLLRMDKLGGQPPVKGKAAKKAAKKKEVKRRKAGIVGEVFEISKPIFKKLGQF